MTTTPLDSNQCAGIKTQVRAIVYQLFQLEVSALKGCCNFPLLSTRTGITFFSLQPCITLWSCERNPLALKPLIDNAVNLLCKHQKREIQMFQICVWQNMTPKSIRCFQINRLQSINLLSEQCLADLLTLFESSWFKISVGFVIKAVILFLIYLLLLVDIICGVAWRSWLKVSAVAHKT